MPDATVIHFGTRKPLEEALQAETEAMIQDLVEEEQGIQNDKTTCVELLDDLKALVAQGRLTGLIVIGLDPLTDNFMTEVRMAGPQVGREKMFAYVGILETLKAEVMDAAMMAPMVTSKGEVIDPYDEPEDEE